MASYLFYSPHLDGFQPPNVNSANLGGAQEDFSLTPQFGGNNPPSNFGSNQMSNISGGTHPSTRGSGHDISEVPLGAGQNSHQQGSRSIGTFGYSPYIGYVSPFVGPSSGYSPMMYSMSPMMYSSGAGLQDTFEPLPESWDKGDPTIFHQNAPSYHRPRNDYYNHQTDMQSHHSQNYRVNHHHHQSQSHHQPSHYHQPSGKSVLDELHQPRAQNLEDIINDRLIADLATDQNGSRFIQTKLEDASDVMKQRVFEQMLPETLRLCTDVFGNYCIQKFFEYGTVEQKQQLAAKIQDRVLPLSLQMYGCRVVQKILESVDVSTQMSLIHELEEHILECVKDQNANHVIQKCIERVPPSHPIIQAAFTNRVFDLSTHPYGCRVIQRMLEHCPTELKIPLLEELAASILQLSKDQYGNYVLQHVLQHSDYNCKNSIITAVAKNILNFSKHKFASNVVERCFVAGKTEQQGDVLLDAVIGVQDNSPLVLMVRDQYGNYVIQKMLETLSVTQRDKLIKYIREFVPNIRKIAFGKHIVAKIEKLTGQVI